MIEVDCLLIFVLWRDDPRVFMRMRGTTVSEKLTQPGLLLIAIYKIDV